MTTFERLFVWVGGALFAVSLAVLGFTYAVTWSVPSTGSGPSAVTADVALVSLFALHHSLFARESVKARLARILPERLLRSFYVWTASLLLLIVLALWQRVGGELYRVTGWPAIVNIAVQLLGLWLIARAVAKIDPLELAGIRQPAAPTDPSAAQALQITGPYRWVRHPVYSGWLLALFGAAAMTADRVTFAATTTLYLLVAIPWEERSLERTFGDAYARYRASVRWRVVPYVY